MAVWVWFCFEYLLFVCFNLSVVLWCLWVTCVQFATWFLPIAFPWICVLSLVVFCLLTCLVIPELVLSVIHRVGRFVCLFLVGLACGFWVFTFVLFGLYCLLSGVITYECGYGI